MFLLGRNADNHFEFHFFYVSMRTLLELTMLPFTSYIYYRIMVCSGGRLRFRRHWSVMVVSALMTPMVTWRSNLHVQLGHPLYLPCHPPLLTMPPSPCHYATWCAKMLSEFSARVGCSTVNGEGFLDRQLSIETSESLAFSKVSVRNALAHNETILIALIVFQIYPVLLLLTFFSFL